MDGPSGMVHLMLTHDGGATSTALAVPGRPDRGDGPGVRLLRRERHRDRPARGRTTPPRRSAWRSTSSLEQVRAGTRDHRCDVRFGREVVAILAAAETARTEGRTIHLWRRSGPSAPSLATGLFRGLLQLCNIARAGAVLLTPADQVLAGDRVVEPGQDSCNCTPVTVMPAGYPLAASVRAHGVPAGGAPTVCRRGRRVAAAMLVQRLGAPSDFDPLLERVRDARVVMIGEATHGSYDYYRLREQLTRRLIAEQGFDFVAVEGDWPDCDRVHRSVVGRARRGGRSADRAGTVRTVAHLDVGERRGGPVLPLAAGVEPGAAGGGNGPASTGSTSTASGSRCRRSSTTWARRTRPRWRRPRTRTGASSRTASGSRSTARPAGSSPPAARRRWSGCWRVPGNRPPRTARTAFSAWQNAEVVAGAERYYRAMVGGGPDSWNVRDIHMADTLDRLLRPLRPGRAGDRLGAQHARRGRAGHRHGRRTGWSTSVSWPGSGTGRDAVALIGFGSYRGTVVAAPRWGSPAEAMVVPPAREGSVERRLHELMPERAVLVFGGPDQPDWVTGTADHRAIGVVYDPTLRVAGATTCRRRLGERYDAFIWCDETTALHPLPALPPSANGDVPRRGVTAPPAGSWSCGLPDDARTGVQRAPPP